MEINFNDIFIEGISQITPIDIEFAAQFGFKIKLLAISKNRKNGVEARVHPAMIPCYNPLSNVNGSLNAVTICGKSVNNIMLYGLGAGMMPTANAVVGDIVDISRNLLYGSTQRVPLQSYQKENIQKIPVVPIDDIATNYYFRFSAVDSPGVLSKISGILGDHGISIKSVHQKGRKSVGAVPIVILTHLAKELDVKKALSAIESLDIVKNKPVLIRVEENNYSD
jgi:homoserine dehydrogenase